MTTESVPGFPRRIRDRLFGGRFQRRIKVPVPPEAKPARKPDRYHYGNMTQLINDSFGGSLPDDTPTELLTRYFDFWKKSITPEDRVIEEASAGYWEPIMQALKSRERHMITTSMHAVRRNQDTIPTVLDIRELDQKNPVYLWLGRSCKRVLQESFNRSD